MTDTLLAKRPAQHFHGYVDTGFKAVDPDGRVWFMGESTEGDSDGFDTVCYAAISGQEVRGLHWSRFENYTDRHFRMCVEMGFPHPTELHLLGNWKPADLERVYAAKVSA